MTLLQPTGRALILSVLYLCICQAWAADPMSGHSLMPPSPIHTQQGQHVVYGRVVATMNSGGYTYVQLNTGSKKLWAAGPITQVKQGDAVRVSTTMPMRHFHSTTLKRDFVLVYFTNKIVVAPGSHASTTATMTRLGQAESAEKPSALAGLKPAKHGKSIAEIFRERKQLAGKQVRVRGKVVQYVGNIYGKNWLHIRDSSSQRSLLVVTKDKTQADVVLVKGTVVLEKDNGIGHVYKVMLDDARILGQ